MTITPNMKSKLPPAMLAGLEAYRKKQAEAKASGTPLVRKKKVKREKKPQDAVISVPVPEIKSAPLPGVKTAKRKYNKKPKLTEKDIMALA